MANFRTVNRRIVTHGLSINGAEIPSIYVHPVTTPTETVIRLVQAEIDNIKGED